MADDDLSGPASPPSPGWPHRPVEPERQAPGPWTAPPRQGGPVAGRPLPASPQPPGSPRSPRERRRLAVVIGAIVGVVVLGGVAAALVLGGGDGGNDAAGTDPAPGGTARTIPGRTPAPPGSGAAPAGPGAELTLLGGKLVVAARPGWEALPDSAENSASLRLQLQGPNGRPLLSTLTIATLSSASSFDTVLTLTGGTSFDVAGPDGPYRVTAQPGVGARIVAGADRKSAAYFMNLSISALDGVPLDVAALRALFTDQVAPALRFP